jgi:hypothetical protein
MRSFAIIAALSLATVFVMLNKSSAHAQTPEETNTKPVTTAVTNVIVQPGDNLTAIATANSTTYVRLFDANTQIVDPDIINPGDIIRIPAADEVLTSRSLPENTPAQPVASYSQSAAKPRATQQAPAASATASVGGDVWDSIARCESGGNWSTNTGNGYYGGLQFSLSSWRAVGGSGLPSQASKAEQIARAEILKSRQGFGAWPACTAKLGLR